MSSYTKTAEVQEGEILGVVGGMGPLASAEFVSRLYKYFSFGSMEQSAPFVIQYSNPAIPDRSTNFLKGETQCVYDGLLKALEVLDRAGATKYVICCFTMHHVVDQLPSYFKDRIISLVDVTVRSIQRREGKFLFLATKGTHQMKVLEAHQDWDKIKDKICFMSEAHQEALHGFIYKYLKRGVPPISVSARVLAIVKQYEVSGFIAGCTEIHLLTSLGRDEQSFFYPYSIIDPLDIIARNPLLVKV
ncbi:MAG: aspartate/glutamate racemase family protein [Saprospiraceae bacterium]